MKILHVTQNYFPSIGGTQHTMKEVSDFLHSTYHDEVTVYTSDSYFGPNRFAYKKITPSEEWVNGVFVKRFNFFKRHKKPLHYFFKFTNRAFKVSMPFSVQNIYNGPFSPAMFRALQKTTADVIGASSISYLFADYPIWRKHSANPKPFVLYGALHLNEESAVPEQFLQRVKNCEYYIANTSFEKDFLVKKNIDNEKIVVLGAATGLYKYRSILNETYQLKQNYGFKEEDILITFIGRQEGTKNIQLLIDAFSVLAEKYSYLKLIIAGAEGSFSRNLRNISLNNDKINVFTNITEGDKSNIIAISDLIVLPSASESFGVVFLEAWCFSKPVIGANIGAVASIIDHGYDGYLFEPDNLCDLANCMEVLILDKYKRWNFGLAGYEKVQKYYTWEKVAGGFRKVYQLAIDKFNSTLKYENTSP